MIESWDAIAENLARFEPQSSFDDVEKFIESNDDFVLVGQPGPASGVALDLEKKHAKKTKCFVPMGAWSLAAAGRIEQANPQEIDWRKEKIIIASYHGLEIAWKLIKNYGLRCLREFVFFDHVYLLNNPLFRNSAGALFYEYYTRRQDDFTKAYQLLSDELSRITYAKILKYRTNAFNPELMTPGDLPTPLEIQYEYEKNAKIFADLVPNNISPPLRGEIAFKLSLDAYSYLDVVSPRGKRVILNIGAYNNSSAPLALSAKGGRVYAFEPQADKHADNIALSKVFAEIIPVPKGVWKESTRLSFKIDESATGGTTASYVSDKGDSQIEVVSIDDFVKENGIKPDFIKMDTEGAELEGLEGGKETIKEYLPDLAISIYHHPSHLHLIPEMIRKFDERYRIFIGHKYFDFMESVLFATLA